MISIWEKETFFAKQDVIVVGSGFVGLWSALFLKKKHPKLKISIIDRGIIPTGASTRNAGFACFGSLSELMQDAKNMGIEKMLQLVEMRFKGLELISKHFSKSNLDYELCGGYELFGAGEYYNEEKIGANISYMNSLLKPVTDSKKTFRLEDENISEFGFGNTKHLVKNRYEGYLHSGKLIRCLLQKAQGMGVQVFTGIDIKKYELQGDSIVLDTDRGINFTTERMLICTNAFAKELLPDEDIIPARGQVLLTSPIADLKWKGSFHSEEGFYYFRNLGNKVLLGGARNTAFPDEETTEFTTTENIQQVLEKYLSDVVLPGYAGDYTIQQRWSGIMAMGGDKMPIVKKLSSNVYCAIRMSGMGVALAPVVGAQVANMMFD